MKIHRTRKVWEQVKLAKGIQAELIRLIGRKVSIATAHGKNASEWQALRAEVALTAESFSVRFQQCTMKDVDRRTSMLFGPFFTSTEYPHPNGELRPMVPIVQLELLELSAAIQDKVGDGLLQLWYDIDAQKELVRPVPLADAYEQDLTEFDLRALADNEFPLPNEVQPDSSGKSVQVIASITSTGMQSDYGAIETLYVAASDDEDTWLWTLLTLFCKCTPAKSGGSIEIFGTHSPIQYWAHEVNMRRLINLSDWGSAGHAQIFYRAIKNAPTEFKFLDCVR